MTQFIHFGEPSRRKLHEILSHCGDYDEDYTQAIIEHAMRSSYHPCTCRWAKEMRLGCPDSCKGSGGKSPIKFAWTPLRLEELKKAYKEILLLAPEDDYVIEICLATMLDTKISGDLAWLLLIAPPAWGKTVILTSLHDSSWSYLIDMITEKTFISGKTYFDRKSGEDLPIEGLLPKLHMKTLISKEFTTQIMQGEDSRKAIFGQLRGIYDENYSQAFGSFDFSKYPEEWKHVRMGLIAGCTPYIDRYSTMNVILGERYLKLRMRETDRLAANKFARMSTEEKKKKAKSLSSKTKRFLANVEIPTRFDLPPEDIGNALDHLAEFIVQCRAPVDMRQSTIGTIMYEYETQRELGTRVVQQLQRLGWMLQCIRKTKFDIEIYKRLLRVGFDTVVPDRINIVFYLYNQKKPTSETNIRTVLGWGNSRIKHHLRELVLLNVVQETENVEYVLNDYIRKCLSEALLHSSLHLQDVGYHIPSLSNIKYKDTPYMSSAPYYGKVHAIKIEDDLTTEELRTRCYGDDIKETSYLQNRCMTCGRVPVGKNFELIRDCYAELTVKVCRSCYLRIFYYGGALNSDRWLVLT